MTRGLLRSAGGTESARHRMISLCEASGLDIWGKEAPSVAAANPLGVPAIIAGRAAPGWIGFRSIEGVHDRISKAPVHFASPAGARRGPACEDLEFTLLSHRLYT